MKSSQGHLQFAFVTELCLLSMERFKAKSSAP